MSQAWQSSTQTTPLIFLVLGPSDSNRNYTIGSPSSPACELTLQILGLASLHNYTSQFLIMDLFIHLYIYDIHIHILLVLFLWRTLIQSCLKLFSGFLLFFGWSLAFFFKPIKTPYFYLVSSQVSLSTVRHGKTWSLCELVKISQ